MTDLQDYADRLRAVRQRNINFLRLAVDQIEIVATNTNDRRFGLLVRLLRVYVRAAQRTHDETPIASTTIDYVDVLAFDQDDGRQMAEAILKALRPSLETRGLWNAFLQMGFWPSRAGRLGRWLSALASPVRAL